MAVIVDHTSHDSVSVLRTTFIVYGKRQTLTLSQTKTPKPIVTKFECFDYVVNHCHHLLYLPNGYWFGRTARNVLGKTTYLLKNNLLFWYRFCSTVYRLCFISCHCSFVFKFHS